MSGLRFARNRVHHQWSDALAPHVGHEGDFVGWVWRAVDELPRGRHDPSGETTYRDRLEGSRVEEALGPIGAAFFAMRIWLPDGPRFPAVF